MRSWAPGLAVGFVLIVGLLAHPAAQLVASRPITYAEAQLLVLDTAPVLQAFNRGLDPVIGPAAGLTKPQNEPGVYTIHVLTRSQRQLGTYRVVAATGQVYDATTGKELRNAELVAAENILRKAHGIALATPAALSR